ncbi:cytochrome P450 [Mesorhizobium sp. M0106]|uniref:hypothetical protein n=1 Tax=Mesorhizobium sp. M0106 TaxID=2956880 RepID=UPI00333B1531
MVLSSPLQSRVGSSRSLRPPGPKGLPFLGDLVAFGRDELGFITETARRYGDVWLNLAGWPALLVSDVEAIETILVKDHDNYIKHRLALRHVKALWVRRSLPAKPLA